MSVAEKVRQKVQRTQRGKPFSNSGFIKLSSRSAVDKALSCLVKKGVMQRVSYGVFVRPKVNRFVGTVMPEISQIIQVIAKNNHETIQIHGAEAARRFKLSTQMPTTLIFYTSGSSREIHIGKRVVKLMHRSSRKLQHAGTKIGLALSALWYCGEKNINSEVIRCIRQGMSEKEFKVLLSCDIPAWMRHAIESAPMDAPRA